MLTLRMKCSLKLIIVIHNATYNFISLTSSNHISRFSNFKDTFTIYIYFFPHKNSHKRKKANHSGLCEIHNNSNNQPEC